MDIVRDSLTKLYKYCECHNWQGYDPFDGLNSKVFQILPVFRNHRFCRMLFLQWNKKSPVNFRPILRVEKERNPKGTGLFLSAITQLYERSKSQEYLNIIHQLVDWLGEDISPGYSGDCWGYNFDWQSRAFFLPKGTPTVVNTSFIGRAFLKAYEVLETKEYLQSARSSCDFILNDLTRYEKDDCIGFSYSPIDFYYVNNATALASSLLSSVYAHTGEVGLAEIAKKSMHYVVHNQLENGGWNYGEDKTGRSVGIDNFHTGFVLESLKIYMDKTGDYEYSNNIKRGLKFYQDNFFEERGRPKYFHNKLFPIDIHSAAQSIITLIQLKNYGSNMDLCEKIVQWMIRNMQDNDGYVYYQKRRFFLNKIPYMRWSQAWAFNALTTFLLSNE